MALPFRLAWAEWLGAVTLLPWLLAIELCPRHAFRRAYAGGFVFVALGLSWLSRVSPVATILAAGYFALYPALFGALAAHLRHASRWPLWVVGPICMVTTELAAEYLTIFNVTWLFPGAVLWRCVPLIQLVELGGVSLISALIAGTASAALSSILAWHGNGWRWRGSGAWRPLAVGCAVLVGAFAWGAIRVATISTTPGPRIALVQGNVPQSERLDPRRRDEVLVKHARLSDRLRGQEVAIVAWPESSSAHFLDEDAEAREFLAGVARRLGAFLIVGAIGSNPVPQPPSNSAFVFARDGRMVGRSDKRVLVPGAETLLFLDRVQAVREPLGNWLSRNMGFRPYLTPGREAVVHAADSLRFGVLICYGDLVPGPAWELRRAGARALIVLSNEAWFGRLELEQHLAMAAQRCIETRLPMARATNDGATAILDPVGRVVHRLPANQEGVLVGDLPLADTWVVPAAVRLSVRVLHALVALTGLVLGIRGLRRDAATGGTP